MKQNLLKYLGVSILLALCFQVTLFAEVYNSGLTVSNDGKMICSCGIEWEKHLDVLNSNVKGPNCICGGHTYEKLVSTGSPHYTSNYRSCTHGKANGHDYEQKTRYTYEVRCTNIECSFSTEYDRYRYSWDCKGF